MACPLARAPSKPATAEAPIMHPSAANHCPKLTNQSPPASRYPSSIQYSAIGCSMICVRYGDGKKRTLPCSAQYTTRGMWYAMASVLLGGLYAAVTPVAMTMARQPTIASRMIASTRGRMPRHGAGRRARQPRASAASSATLHTATIGPRRSRPNALSISVASTTVRPNATAARRNLSRQPSAAAAAHHSAANVAGNRRMNAIAGYHHRAKSMPHPRHTQYWRGML